jgi:hypothetical protein
LLLSWPSAARRRQSTVFSSLPRCLRRCLAHVEAPETNAILTSVAPAFTWPILSSFDLHIPTLHLPELTTRIARLGQFLSFSPSLFLLQLRIFPLASTVPRFSLFSISNSSSWSWVLSTDNSDAQSCPAQPYPTLLSPVSLLSGHLLILRLCPLQLALLLHLTSVRPSDLVQPIATYL